MIFFTADSHYGHENIIEYCSRPFKNASKMDHELVRRHNKIVSDTDLCYFLGDFSIKGSQHKQYIGHIVSQLQGRKILILGNHDKLDPFDYVELGFESVHTSLYLPEFNLLLVHDPALHLMKRDAVCLCGHIHILFKYKPPVLNIGVDMWGFFPASLEEVLKVTQEANQHESIK